ncbi:MAG: TetR/AcrR family transcriptional regulator [Phycisphaerales bacterium]
MEEPRQNDAAAKRDRDQRVQQTRSAIVDSLNELVFERPYDEINVPDILNEAGVGRSTFYEHFRNKDQAILHSATDVLSVMADSIVPGSSRDELIHKLEHFRGNRRMVLDLLSGPIGAQMTHRTADLMQQRLEEIWPREAEPAAYRAKARGSAVRRGAVRPDPNMARVARSDRNSRPRGRDLDQHDRHGGRTDRAEFDAFVIVAEAVSSAPS